MALRISRHIKIRRRLNSALRIVQGYLSVSGCLVSISTQTAPQAGEVKQQPTETRCTRVYPEVSELAAWSENSKWYILPLGAVVSLFY
jgi:hypothetical protein